MSVCLPYNIKYKSINIGINITKLLTVIILNAKQLIPKVQFLLGRANQEEAFIMEKKAVEVPLEVIEEIKEKDILLETMAKRMNRLLEELRQLEA